MKRFWIYAGRQWGRDNTADFPDLWEIHDLDDFRHAVQWDYNPCRFTDFHRSAGNFAACSCVFMDVDNEELTLTLDDLRNAFPDVEMWIHYSRNHMKEKVKRNGKICPAAPRFHVLFPLGREYTDHDEVYGLKERIFSHIQGFDRNALAVTQFARATRPPKVEVIEGSLCVDDFMATVPANPEADIQDPTLRAQPVPTGDGLQENTASHALPALRGRGDVESGEYTRAALVEALNYINPDIPRDEWIAVGMALKHEDMSFEVWDRWSREGAKYDGSRIRKEWDSFHDNSSRSVTAGTIFMYAKRCGFDVSEFLRQKKARAGKGTRNCVPAETQNDHLATAFIPPLEPGELLKEHFLDQRLYQLLMDTEPEFQRELLIERCAARARELNCYKTFASLKKAFQNDRKAAEAARARNMPVGSFFELPPDSSGARICLNLAPWQISDGQIMRYLADDKTETACLHPVFPARRLKNVDTDAESLVLIFTRNKGVTWQRITAPTDVVYNSRDVTKLARYGIAVTSRTASSFSDYIADVENQNHSALPQSVAVDHLGYIPKYGFCPYCSSLEYDGDVHNLRLFKSIHCHGDYTRWKQMAMEVMTGSLQGMIGMAAAFASALVEVVGANCFFVHFWGETGCGKTVLLNAAASVYANPREYVFNYDSTQVGLELTAAFLNNLPLCIDELQLAKGRDGKTHFNPYALAQGTGRLRGTREIKARPLPRWRLCILSSGEDPLNSSTSGAGAINRTLDIQTESGKKIIVDGRKTNAEACENYGFAGKEFIERLYSDPQNKKMVQDMYSTALDQMAYVQSTEKQTAIAALILVAARLAREWIFQGQAPPLEPGHLTRFLPSANEVNAGPRAYRYFCGWIAQNQVRFTECPTELYGYLGVRRDSGTQYAAILRHIFDEECTRLGYDSLAILKYFRANNLIITRDGKGYTMNARVGGVPSNCVFLKLLSGVDGTRPDSAP